MKNRNKNSTILREIERRRHSKLSAWYWFHPAPTGKIFQHRHWFYS